MARHVFVDEIEAEGRYVVVAVARDGQALVDAVREHQPDLIVTDMVMPKLSGLQAIREIRRFSKAPILAMTGTRLDVDTIRMAALSAGADGFVQKQSETVNLELMEQRSGIMAALDKIANLPRDRPMGRDARYLRNRP